jgi:hypothetical protein
VKLILIIAGAMAAGILVVGLVLWSTMKVSHRRQVTGFNDSAGSGGYQAPGYPDADPGGSD